ncbi:MAG: DUF5602 domain-containing protein [Anaerolineales bacterium]|nr:DUF5602 domain-containing protein [Anaerolineales bacterium]
MSIRSRLPITMLLLVAFLLLGCTPGEPDGKTFIGDSIELGEGELHTWARLDLEGNPVSVGVTFTEGMLSGLPGYVKQYSMEMPEEAASTLFTHVLFDWNPAGHDPVGRYTVPHFDFTFYTIPVRERASIPQGQSTTGFEPQHLPQDYFRTVAFSFGAQGVYWQDAGAPEWNGQRYTEATLIYGSYEGQMIFIEPMITKKYLETKPNVTHEIKQPQAYQRSGYYPTEYRIGYQDGEYTVSLENFVFSEGA